MALNICLGVITMGEVEDVDETYFKVDALLSSAPLDILTNVAEKLELDEEQFKDKNRRQLLKEIRNMINDSDEENLMEVLNKASEVLVIPPMENEQVIEVTKNKGVMF